MNVVEIDAEMVKVDPPVDGVVTVTFRCNSRVVGERDGVPMTEGDFVMVRMDAELATSIGASLTGN